MSMDDSTAPFLENHIPSPLDIIPGSVVRIPAGTPTGREFAGERLFGKHRERMWDRTDDYHVFHQSEIVTVILIATYRGERVHLEGLHAPVGGYYCQVLSSVGLVWLWARTARCLCPDGIVTWKQIG